MTVWALPWSGGCRCGQTRIEVTAPPLIASACHCKGCQTMTASAFALTLTLPEHGLRVTQGEPVIGGLHGATRHFFCPYCLTWMFTRPAGDDGFVNLRPSTLDDHAWFAPFIEVFTEAKLPWAETGAVHSYPTFPEMADYGSLARDYAERGARPRA
jgi:hypothetical protein